MTGAPGSRSRLISIAAAERSAPTPLKTVEGRLRRALATSTADDTELVWIESRARRSNAGLRRSGGSEAPPERATQVRVRAGERWGSFRVEGDRASELEDGLRSALAQARGQRPTAFPRMPPGRDRRLTLRRERVFDPQIADLTEDEAKALLGDRLQRGERGRLSWRRERVVVVNSRGLSRRAAVTCCTLEVRCGRGALAGMARGSARTDLETLIESVLHRARSRCLDEAAATPDRAGPPPAEAPHLVLSPEATGQLISLFARSALSSYAAGLEGAFLQSHLGQTALSELLSIRDDALDDGGLPFPFDLEGRRKRPVYLVDHGRVLTAAADRRVANLLGLPMTPHFVDLEGARPAHLFLEPGETAIGDLLRMGDNGLWISSLESLQCFDPANLEFQAVARGVRSLRDGKLEAAVPRLLWCDRLTRVLAAVRGVGDVAVCQEVEPGLFGGVSAPALAVEAGGRLSVRPADAAGPRSDRRPGEGAGRRR